MSLCLYLPSIRERKHDYENEEVEAATVAVVNVITTAAAFFIPDRGCQRVPRTKLNAFLTVYMTR